MWVGVATCCFGVGLFAFVADLLLVLLVFSLVACAMVAAGSCCLVVYL